jgi:hypothetical protein
MNEETYKMNVVCANCLFKGEIEMEKGIKPGGKECPKCGCFELSRYDSPVLFV